MNGPRQRYSINLFSPSHQPLLNTKALHEGRIRTVLTLNTPTTLSHSVPSFGLQLSSFANALASLSTRSLTSTAEYPNPVSPHVKGCLAWWRGWRPYCSFSMNSLIGMESGGSKGSSGTHCGGWKTIVMVKDCASSKVHSIIYIRCLLSITEALLLLRGKIPFRSVTYRT